MESRGGQLVQALRATLDARAAKSIAEALRELPGGPSGGDVRDAHSILVGRLSDKPKPWDLEPIAEAIREVPGDLSANDAGRCQVAILSALESEGTDRPWLIGRATAVIATKLTREQADGALHQWIGAVAGATDRGKLSVVAAMVASCPWAMPDELVSAAFAKLWLEAAGPRESDSPEGRPLDDQREIQGRWQDEQLMAGLCAVARRLGREDAEGAQRDALHALGAAKSLAQFERIAIVLSAIPREVPRGIWKAEALRLLGSPAGSPMESLSVFSRHDDVICRLARKLSPEEANEVLLRVAEVVDHARAQCQSSPVRQAVPDLVERVDAQSAIDYLKWPSCVGEVRASALAALEKRTGRAFGGNLWQAVVWAEAAGLDVRTPPRRPGR